MTKTCPDCKAEVLSTSNRMEPVVWRWRHVNSPSKDWNYQREPIGNHNEYLEVEPLYAAQPATPAVGGGREALRPFAFIADQYDASEAMRDKAFADEGNPPGPHAQDTHRVSITLGDCRKARAALAATPAEREVLQRAIDSAFSEKGLYIDWQLRNAVVDKIISTCPPAAQPASPLRGREAAIEECAHAAFKAYGSITSEQYVLEGPAGLAKRMINAIHALVSAAPPEQPAPEYQQEVHWSSSEEADAYDEASAATEQLKQVDAEDIWSNYCTEVAEENRSPQGALAFAVETVVEIIAGGLVANPAAATKITDEMVLAAGMTDLVKRLRDRAKVTREENTGTAFGDAIHFEEAANEIERLCIAQPQYLANCLQSGGCHGQCESERCTNYGKVIVVRRCVEERK